MIKGASTLNPLILAKSTYLHIMKSFSLHPVWKNKSIRQKLCLMSKFIGWLSRKGLINDDSTVYSDLTCVIYGYFGFIMRFLVLIQVSAAMMVIYSENFMCFAIWDKYICHYLGDAGVLMVVFIFIVFYS